MTDLKMRISHFSKIAFLIIFIAAGCSSGEQAASDDNTAPKACAGMDLNVLTGFTVTLDGSGSSDPDGDALTYQWEFKTRPANSTATLSEATSVYPSFTPDVDGVYVISLVVHDGKLDSVVETVTFIAGATAQNPPVADAGINRNAVTGSLVILDGSGSYDPDGDELHYNWVLQSRPAGSSAFLSDAGSAKPSFTPDVDGAYVISLVVNDGSVDSDFSYVTVTAGSSAENPPVADAGPNRNVVTGLIVTLDGSGSSDPDGDALSYLWTISSKPANSTVSLSSASSVNPSFMPDIDGVYVINLVVNDGKVDSAVDSVRITATSNANNPPVADAGDDRNVDTSSLVILDGSGSSDPDGDTLSYQWAFQSRPPGSSSALSSATTASPSFTPDVDGMYRVRLVVNDGTVDSAVDTVAITATTSSPGNTAPVADAGDDQDVVTGLSVSLSGSDSYDPDGDILIYDLNYTWTITSKPPGSSATLDSPFTRNTSFTPDAEGVYKIRLVVNDGFLDSAPDEVVITATQYSLVSDYDIVNFECAYSTNNVGVRVAELVVWIVNRGASDPGASLTIEESDVCLGDYTHISNQTINETPDGNNSTAFTFVVEPVYQVITWEAIIRDADNSDGITEYSYESWCDYQ